MTVSRQIMQISKPVKLHRKPTIFKRGRGVIDVTYQSSIKSLYETSAVSLFTRLPTPTLLAARGIAALKSRSQSRFHVFLFCVLPTDFRGKERLLAVYSAR